MALGTTRANSLATLSAALDRIGRNALGVFSGPILEKTARISVVSGVLALGATVLPVGYAYAESIEVLLPYVVDNHDRVRADEARLRAARNRAREALGDWYPTLSQTANAGTERQQNDNGDDSSTGFSEWDISLTQLLWDFGSTNAAIDKARLQVEEARLTLVETRQSLILEAITDYMNLIRAHQSLKFAQQSEENIRKQTGLEEALVGLGSGFSTDVLQAKSQLAGAQARRASSEGGLSSALNRYKAVFGRVPDNVDDLETVPFPAPFLPTSLTQATDIALEMNPSLKNAILAANIAMEDVRIARADNFTPRIEATGERKFKKNVGGTIGSEQETLAKVEMTFDFNLGFTAINTLKASKQDLSATTYSAADTRRNIEEQVRNAWQQLDTAKSTASHLDNQANIEAAFLDLARNERQLGRRSLIDVLTGETTLINAKSDALSARTDVVIAAYGLLASTGLLEYDIIKESKGIEPPIHKQDSTVSAPDAPAAAPVAPVTPSPAAPDQGHLYDPDITATPARSSADLKRMMMPPDEPVEDKIAEAPLSPPIVKELAAISSHDRSIRKASDALTFDTTLLTTEERDFTATLEVQVEYASIAPVVAIAPDITVVTDISDTAIATSVPLEMAFMPVRVADPIMDVDRAHTAFIIDDEPPAPIMAPVRAINIEEMGASAPAAPVQEVADIALATTPAPLESTATETASLFGSIFEVLEEAHQAHLEARHTEKNFDPASIEVATAPIDTMPEPVREPAVPDTLEEATGSTFSNFFQFLEDAHQRKLAADNGLPEEPAKQTTVASLPDLPPTEDVPETLPEAIEATFSALGDNLTEAEDAAKQPAPTQPIETARLPQMEELSPEEAEASPDTWERSAGATFGGFLDFMEKAHQRKLESEREKSAGGAQPLKPAAKKASEVQQVDQDTTPDQNVQVLGNPVASLFSSIGSVFGEVAEVDLSYRPLRDDERSIRD